MDLCRDFGSFWQTLRPRQKRIAEESALLGWDNPELLKFAKYRHECLNRKKMLRSQYGHSLAKMTLETGIILTEEELEALSEHDDLLNQFLFNHPLYQKYVLACAQRICKTTPAPENLAKSALQIFYQVMKLKNIQPRCPDLLKVTTVFSLLSNAEKMRLRLVCRSVSTLIRNQMLMQISIMNQAIYVPLSFSTNDLRVLLNLPPDAKFVRYGKFGPLLPEGPICYVSRAEIFILDKL